MSKQSKFKIGDKIVVTQGDYSITIPGTIGTVIETDRYCVYCDWGDQFPFCSKAKEVSWGIDKSDIRHLTPLDELL